MTSALAEPANTIHLLTAFGSEAKSIVASCVLSPISARNTVPNTVANVCQLMISPRPDNVRN